MNSFADAEPSSEAVARFAEFDAALSESELIEISLRESIAAWRDGPVGLAR
jgi:hypothetical protein